VTGPGGRARARVRALLASIELRVRAVYLASRHPRVPRAAKVLAAVVAAYALSPIDLIPDVIPVLGLLDDLILIPLGVALVVRLIPRDTWQECLAAARDAMDAPRSRVGLILVLVAWAAALAALAWIVVSRL
jgi:uncharacterized membrane protein YkvA (DUF1232 family)